MKKNVLIFDFDSTIIGLESLDEIAKEFLKKHPEKEKISQKIEQITDLGMVGKIDFNESLRRRVELINPSKKQIQNSLKKIEKSISKSFLENKKWIQKNREDLFVISGGFKEILIPVCTKIGFKKENIFGNEFVFDSENENGKVVDFNKKINSAKNQGKVLEVESLNLRKFFDGKIVIIGDGFTDYEIKKNKEADYFICYTEHKKRENIAQLADLEVVNLDEVIDFLEKLN